jgi:hypothetical protein
MGPNHKTNIDICFLARNCFAAVLEDLFVTMQHLLAAIVVVVVVVVTENNFSPETV